MKMQAQTAATTVALCGYTTIDVIVSMSGQRFMSKKK